MKICLLSVFVIVFCRFNVDAQLVKTDSINLGEDRSSHNYQEFGSSISMGNYTCSGDSSITLGGNSQDDSIVFEMSVFPNTDEVTISWNYAWFNAGMNKDMFTRIVIENVFEEALYSPGPNAIGSSPIGCDLDSHMLTFSGLSQHTADGSIKVKIYDPYPAFNGNSSISQFHVFADTPPQANGLQNDAFFTELNVFPNPTKGSVYVEFSDKQASTSLRLYDATGQLVQEQLSTNSSQVEMELNQPSGFYFLSIESDNQRRVIKVVKE
jgi:hypothetical protein